MFIIGGVLYAIDSATDSNTKIRLALDLYRTKLVEVSLNFTNPFAKTTTVGYNHKKMVNGILCDVHDKMEYENMDLLIIATFFPSILNSFS